MPIFEYVCRECGQQFESIVTASRAARCPSCSSDALDKQLSVFAVAASGPRETPAPPVGGCGRCGDPNGPCSLD